MPDEASSDQTGKHRDRLVSFSNVALAAKFFVVFVALLLPAMVITGFGPLWPTSFGVAVLSLLTSTAAFAWSQGFTDSRGLRRRLISVFIVSGLGLSLFFGLFSALTVTVHVPPGQIRIQKGFTLTEEARRFAEQQAKSGEVLSDERLLMIVGLDRGLLWTPQSVAYAGLAILCPWLLFCFGGTSAATLIAKTFPNHEVIAKRRELERAAELVEQEPDRNRAVWDLARIRLELYFDRNLTQISAIFWLSVAVMLAGFGLIVFSINRALGAPGTVQSVSVISAASGIITEFVGATFLFLYRSTIQQATANIRTLERINAVGMAVAILDTISPASSDLSDQTKSAVVKALIKTADFRDIGTKGAYEKPT